MRSELADREAFADRSLNALQADAVRGAIAEQVAVELLERQSPEFVAARPLVLAAVEAMLETDSFARILRRAARNAHEVLFEGDRNVVIELEELNAVLAQALESADPALARQLPEDLSPQIAEIRRSHAATAVVRVADGARAASWPLLIMAGLLLAAGVVSAGDRRRAAGLAGLLLALGMALGLGAMALLREEVVSQADELGVLSDDDARAAAAAAWDAFAGGLEDWIMFAAVGGLAVAAGVFIVESRIDRAGALRQAGDVLAGGRLPRAVAAARGLAVGTLGALVLLGTQPFREWTIYMIGGALLLLGVSEMLGTLRPSQRTPGRRAGRRYAVAAALLVSLGVGVTVVLLSSDDAPDPLEESELTACNGLPALCDRRLDEIVFPGTHNSMSAADRSGWFFANQTRPIPEQLDDGVRLLMIDPHYGIVDSRGRVRTDLRAEGTNRNRVARRLSVDGVEAAERLTGRLGLLPTEGDSEIFLCHTLCELGAERMSSTLDEIRQFLEQSPAEVLMVFVESSVDPGDVEREFEKADLDPYLATLPRDGPLPTLREMITSGRRLVVLDQRDGGSADWYQPAFTFLQDTSISALTRSPTACDPGRGSPDNPLLLMNHWIDEFPPDPRANRAVGTREAMLARVRACQEALGREPNLVAVDFYNRSDVIAVARSLNSGLAP